MHLLHEPRGYSCTELADMIAARTNPHVSSTHVLALWHDLQPMLSAVGDDAGPSLLRIESAVLLMAIQQSYTDLAIM
jgi:hypothetical protein